MKVPTSLFAHAIVSAALVVKIIVFHMEQPGNPSPKSIDCKYEGLFLDSILFH